jgi:hypothetical protein
MSQLKESGMLLPDFRTLKQAALSSLMQQVYHAAAGPAGDQQKVGKAIDCFLTIEKLECAREKLKLDRERLDLDRKKSDAINIFQSIKLKNTVGRNTFDVALNEVHALIKNGLLNPACEAEKHS